jgi:hypothetical protein
MLIITPPPLPLNPSRHLLVTKYIVSNTRSQYKAVPVLPLAKNAFIINLELSVLTHYYPPPLVPPIYTPRTKIVALLNNTNISIALSVFSQAFPGYFITCQ